MGIGTKGEGDFFQMGLENCPYKVVNTNIKQKKMIPTVISAFLTFGPLS